MTAGRVRYWIVVTEPDGRAAQYEVGITPVLIGRSAAANARVGDKSVSRLHCVVSLIGGRLAILDQKSANGTVVNGEKVLQAQLSPHDEVQIGSTRLAIKAQAIDSFDAPPTPTQPLKPGQVQRAPLLHERLGILQSTVARLTNMEAMSEICEVVFNALLVTLPVDHAFVVLEGDEEWDGEANVVAQRTRAGVAVVPCVVPTDLADRVRQTGQALYEPSTPEDRHSLPTICVPLNRSGRFLGALLLQAAELPRWVGSSEVLGWLTSFGHAMALAATSQGQAVLSSTSNESETQETLPGVGVDSLLPHRDPSRVIGEQRVELAARLEELEHLQRTRRNLAMGLIHDVKNMAAPLEANLAFLGEVVDAEHRVVVRDSLSCSQRIVDMAQDVLTVSRMEEGTFPLSLHECQLQEILERTVRRHARVGAGKSIVLELGHVEEGLTPRIDVEVMERVLDNLIDNAFRHAGHSGRVSLSAARAWDFLELTVADTGPGVPEEERERIFHDGYRPGGGSVRHHGLGLHFCRIAVEAHGGTVRAEGESGDSRFVVEIPLEDAGDDLDTGVIEIGLPFEPRG